MKVLENNSDKKVLLMLSGGRDSFLAVCRLIADGYCVSAVTYDNGSMSGIHNVNELADRLCERFGTERVQYIGVQPIAQNIKQLINRLLYTETMEMAKEYPNLIMSQVNCLACHTAMYAHAIAYCKANDIACISEGARKQQNFFVELPEMKERYEKLCKENGIELILPVYDLDSDVRRKEELAEWGFLPKSYEPQCWIGCPMLRELSESQRMSLASYYDKEIEPHLQEMIQTLVEKKKVYLQNREMARTYV